MVVGCFNTMLSKKRAAGYTAGKKALWELEAKTKFLFPHVGRESMNVCIPARIACTCEYDGVASLGIFGWST